MKKKKVTVSDLALKFDGMPDAQRSFMEKCAEMIVDIVNKSNEGSINDEELSDRLKDALKPFSNVNNDSFKSLTDDYTKALDTIKTLGEEIEKLKKKGIATDFISKFDETFNEMYDSEKFQSFVNDHGPAAKGFAIKDISMTGNYTGTAMITQQSDIIVTQASDKKDHIRNHVKFLESDEEKTTFAYTEIYDVDRNARYVAENGTLPEGSFKVREKTAEVKRVGTHFRLSKRMLKNRKFVRAFVLLKIVQAVLNAEDFALLRGDGQGDNPRGIINYEGVRAVEDILSDNILSIPATGVEAIKAVANGVMLTLAKPHDLMMEGLRMVITGAIHNTGLNGTFDVIKANDTTLLLEGAKLTADTDEAKKADAAALAINLKNGLYGSIESPNSVDALEAAVSVMTYGELDPTILMLNPLTITSICAEKATDGNRLDVVRDMNGNLRIGGLSVVPSKDIPAGMYFLGDMETGCAIIEYTPLMLEWCDDVETKLKNQVVLYAQEEIIFAVMQPHAFSYGKISTLKNALKKA